MAEPTSDVEQEEDLGVNAACYACLERKSTIMRCLIDCATCWRSFHQVCMEPPMSLNELMKRVARTRQGETIGTICDWRCHLCIATSDSTSIAAPVTAYSSALQSVPITNVPTATSIATSGATITAAADASTTMTTNTTTTTTTAAANSEPTPSSQAPQAPPSPPPSPSPAVPAPALTPVQGCAHLDGHSCVAFLEFRMAQRGRKRLSHPHENCVIEQDGNDEGSLNKRSRTSAGCSVASASDANVEMPLEMEIIDLTQDDIEFNFEQPTERAMKAKPRVGKDLVSFTPPHTDRHESNHNNDNDKHKRDRSTGKKVKKQVAKMLPPRRAPPRYVPPTSLADINNSEDI